MNAGRTVFSQLMDFFPMPEFRRCVERYRGEYKVKNFSCLDQFLALAFAQLTYRESLRDIEACLRGMQPRLYHMGFRSQVARNTLANANEQRDWRIYADVAQVLIREARALYSHEEWGESNSMRRSMPSIRPRSTCACRCFRGLLSSAVKAPSRCTHC
jgi:hypothetical protein